MRALQKIKNNLLFRIISYTGIAGILRLLVGLVSQKVIAVFLGASGLAILANFRNLIELSGAFSSFGAQNGIISQTASSESKSAMRTLLNTTITLFIGASILIGVLVFWQHEWLATQLRIDLTYGALIQASAFTIPFMGLMLLMEAVLNGKKAFKSVSNVQLFIAVATAILMITLLYFYGLLGALIALLCRPVMGFAIYFYHLKNAKLTMSSFGGFRLDISRLKDLLPYIFMSLLAVGLVHLVEIYLRGLISSKIDLRSAGLWTAMNAISSNYFIFISAVFSIYVLPRFSEKIPAFHLLHETKSILKTLLPLVTLGLTAIYLLRIPIIKLLYSVDFISITSLFKWQLTADWIRVVFLVFAYFLVAKKRLIDYVIVELFSFSLLIVLSLCWIDTFGIEGVVMANTARYLGCLILVVFLLRKKLIIRRGG
jgi:PST family polysaccharide transporter